MYVALFAFKAGGSSICVGLVAVQVLGDCSGAQLSGLSSRHSDQRSGANISWQGATEGSQH